MERVAVPPVGFTQETLVGARTHTHTHSHSRCKALFPEDQDSCPSGTFAFGSKSNSCGVKSLSRACGPRWSQVIRPH